MKSKYFNNPQTLEELKKQYRELAFKHHPDHGGTNEDMKAVNAEYELLFPKLKDIHKTKDNETYTAKNESRETPEQFIDLINELMKMDNIVIEIIGCFVWVTGNTKPYKDKLKELKFQWHSKKIAWYLKPEGEKLKTSALYTVYTAHMKLCAVKPISSQEFVGEVRKRYHVKHDYKLGNVIIDAKLAIL